MSRPAKILAWSVIGLFAILALAVAVLLSFDWNRVTPWINSHVSEATGRRFSIDGKLALTWHAPPGAQEGWRHWIPWPHLTAKDVSFGNPDWASEADMAHAREITFSVNPLALLNHRIAIPLLALEAPHLSLERLHDGRNNWTFKTGGGPSAWQLDLQQLILTKASIHLLDAVKRADLTTDIDTLGSGSSSGYRIGWQLAGTFNGAPVNGSGRAGSVLSLREQAKYPVDAHVRIGKTRIDASGTLTAPGRLAALDLRLKIAGVSMAQLYPVINIVLPETPPFSTEGHLTGTLGAMGGNWSYEKFSGKVGASDIAGSLRFQGRRPRPYLEGTVRSNYLNFKDLAPLIGADSNESKALRDAPVRQPEDKALPVEAFKTKRWTSIDADVQFTGRKIVRKAELPIDNLVTRIHLLDGTLSLAPLKFGVAGGALVSNLTLDGKTNPVQAEMKLSARHLKLRQLFPTLEPMRTSLGEINGDAALTARGNSVAALLGSSNGEVKAVINQGTVSKFLLEAMGLNIGSVVVTQLFGDRQVKLNCAVTDFVMDKGIMHPRAFVVDTEDAKIHVNGNIDLGREQLALTIYPESTGLRVISLRSPLYVNGTFKNPDVGVNKGVLAAKAGSAVALGLLAPVAAALIPLVNVGPGEKSECGTLLAQAAATTKPVAPVVGKQGENASGR